MHKKLMLACMAIAAFAAFVIAPAASATTLTSEGIAVPVGTSITAKNTGNTVFTATGVTEVTCSTAHITGTVIANAVGGKQVKGEVPVGNAQFNGTGAGGDCTSGLGDVGITVNSKLCIETLAGTDNLSVNGCNGAKVTFSMLVTSTGTTCRYEGNVEQGASFTTNTSPTPVTVLNGRPAATDVLLETGGSFLCPKEGSLDMVFDLYTTGATPGGPPGAPLTIS
ncbi:MAG TPA: hypothetical protein VNN15_03340 [Solirubrobacterales bacterium]|nr:hypothetical protein [Solirubrobacterales bacterium]